MKEKQLEIPVLEDYKTFSFYVSVQKINALKRLAKLDRRSLSNYIDTIFDEHIRSKRQGEQKKLL